VSKRRILFLPHGNLQYSQLPPERRSWVIEASYERIFGLAAEHGYRLAFEGSGFTIDTIAEQCPRVLRMLRDLVEGGIVEPVASPYTHIMLSNVDARIGLRSLIEGRDAWERQIGVRPTVGWNPECAWTSDIPEIYAEAGFETLVMDADSFLLSFPEVREATGLRFDVTGHSNKDKLFRIEDYIADKPQFVRYLTNPCVAPNGLSLLFRSDVMANPMLWYLMGATEGVRDEPVSLEEIRQMLECWRVRVDETGSFVMPFAEDAEYIGTSAYFYVKQLGQARFFEPEPDAVTRFRQMLDTARELGYELSTPTDILEEADGLIPVPEIARIESGIAWHGGTAKAWANTEYARILDPVCRMIYDGFLAVLNHLGLPQEDATGSLRDALHTLTSAYVSDARWPPAPTSPGRFNVEEAVRDLYAANQALADGMREHGIGDLRSIYSPELMTTQIDRVRDELAAMPYFGE
jgi:hypothetical protein